MTLNQRQRFWNREPLELRDTQIFLDWFHLVSFLCLSIS
jgi:hypothetical protein